MRRVIAPVALAAWLMVAPAAAQQPLSIDDYVSGRDLPRFALAVGVQYYDFLDRVPNALNDLQSAADTLRRAGFITTESINPTGAELRLAIKQLIQLVNQKERPAVIAIYFAGHGFQDGAQNFLVPRDANPDAFCDSVVNVPNTVIKIAPRTAAGISFLFLDACRTLQPLSRPQSPESNCSAPQPGLGQVQNFDGAVLSFAATYNQAALSEAHVHDQQSPYTEALAIHLIAEGESMASTLSAIYSHVKERTGDRQIPEQQGLASTATIRFMPLHTQTDLEAEERHWRATLASNRPECVRRFINSYPDSRFTLAARKWLIDTGAPSSSPVGGHTCPKR